MAQLTPDELLILSAIAADGARIAKLDWQGKGIHSGRPLGRHRMEIEDAQRGIVPLAGSSWLGRELDTSGRKAFSRLIESLARRGLIERIGCGRVTHVKLTETGVKHARLIELKKEIAAHE